MAGFDKMYKRPFIAIKPKLTSQIDIIYPQGNTWIASSSNYGIFSNIGSPIYPGNMLKKSYVINNLKNFFRIENNL